LVTDIGETTNVAQENPDRLRDMATRLDQQLKDKNAQFATIKATGKPIPYPLEALSSRIEN